VKGIHRGGECDVDASHGAMRPAMVAHPWIETSKEDDSGGQCRRTATTTSFICGSSGGGG
jgi:hypothetical protein